MSIRKDKSEMFLLTRDLLALTGQVDLQGSVEGEDVGWAAPDSGSVVVDCLCRQVDVHTGVVTNLSAEITTIITTS